ncbi:MAG TPA: ABC transporter ATP-binding protein [Candidatus Saccharimonadales bacterium]|nr:ABC transporter ATP-binding protein [Candidatus Saccharimonadales bacterium]
MKMIEAKDISFSFGLDANIIGGVSFEAMKDEFVSIIGPSGCGKSTLLRIIAGLIRPTGGKILYLGKKIEGTSKGISFVFQDFALLPWLTNIENVKLGCSMMRLSDNEKNKKAVATLDNLGLSGFEHSYPNVLSGGMKQRVGIARALVSDPKVLLMDEPFSSLDELTAETLRSDILYHLKNKNLPVNSVIMVTHNVEEAVELSDKIVILSKRPSKVAAVKYINLKRPRNKRSKEFLDMMDFVYATLAK